MKVVLAIDSFKGSLSSIEAAEAAALGIKDIIPEAKTVICPIADGGEGTVDAIIRGTGGEYRTVRVTGPLGEPVDATYGYIPDREIAVIEMAAAAGITLVNEGERNPLYTTTYGVGELILDAVSRGARRLIIGIGGSATNDGGAGMLMALGFGLYDRSGAPISRGAIRLKDLVKIDTSGACAALSECEIMVASDVKNPLCGPNGASAVYGPQKGATPDMVRELDGYLSHYARISAEAIPTADPDLPGAGAAGGLGFALVTYLSARLRSGIELVTECVGLSEAVKDADLVITGEGRIDGQSYMGKAPVGVAARAKAAGKPCVAIAGSVSDDAAELNKYGINAVFSITRGPVSLAEAMDKENAKKNIRAVAGQIASLVTAVRSVK